MRIGRPFRITKPAPIQNSDDTFIVLRTKCRTCGRRFKIIAIEVFASGSLYGRQSLECMGCTDIWFDVHEALGIEGRSGLKPVKYVHISL